MYNKLKYTLKILIFKIKSLQYNFTHYNKRVKTKQILLQSFHGNSFSDSPKAIYNEIIKNQDYRDYTIYWAFTNPQNYNF